MNVKATSTNLISFTRQGAKLPMTSVIPRLASWGWKALDLNFCEMMNPHHNVDEAYIRKLEDLKDEHGLDYVQSHAPYFPSYLCHQGTKKEEMDRLIASAISYSVRLGVKAITVHPIDGTVDDNIRYMEALTPLVKGTGSKIAIENMERKEEVSTSSDLNAILDELDPDCFGICLDTGHAHMRGLDVASEIRAYGPRLIATHIADNNGIEDQHLLPFFGSIRWENVMQAFHEVAYPGAICYECMFFTQHLPEDLKEDAVKLSLAVMDKLVSLP